MASLTNSNSSTKSMTGLSDVYSTDINCNNFTVDTSFTITPGCVISLPANSIPDEALSTNVALLNRNPQTFTGANTFSNTTSFTNTMNLTLGNTFNFNASSVANFATTSGGTSNTSIRQTTARLFLIRGEVASSRIEMQVRDASAVIDTCFYADSSTCYISSGTTEVLLSPTTINFTATTTPTMTTQPISSSNSNECASTAWTVSRLASYALLSPVSQTFTGSNNFPTQIISDNSTLAATTAYVKNQGYATTASLASYALLAGGAGQTYTGIHNFPTPAVGTNTTQVATTAYVKLNLLSYALLNSPTGQIFTGLHNFPTQITSDNSTLCATTAYVKNQGYATTASLSSYVTLGTAQTITATKTFSSTDVRFVDGANFTQLYQSGIGFNVVPNHSSSIVSLYTRTSGGALVENIKCQNGNNVAIRGSLSMLNDGIGFSDVGGGANSSAMYQTGPTMTIVNNTNSCSIRLYTKTSGGSVVENIVCANGNTAYLQGDNGSSILVSGTAATIQCATFSSNAPYNCGYLQLGTPITTKTNFNIGYRWSIAGSSFTAWDGYTTPGNVLTIVWDGTGDKELGVWHVEINLVTNTSTDMKCNLGWVDKLSAPPIYDILNDYPNMSNSSRANYLWQTVNLSFIWNITNLTTTYYVNFIRSGGSVLSSNTGASYIKFTRIA